MKATYVDAADILEITDSRFKTYVNEKDLEQFKEEQAKLYFEANSTTGTPKFYWFNDPQNSTNLPVAATADFERGAGETVDLFTLTVDIDNK